VTGSFSSASILIVSDLFHPILLKIKYGRIHVLSIL